MDSQGTQCDVLIIGHSMAGSTLARHLKLRHPEMNIVVVDKKSEFGHWVGESMLEIFFDYASRDLQMGPYLDSNHLYKHGLRFYFDSPEKDLPVAEMSEIGRTWYHGIPSHQIDRKQFDQDILRLNLAAGIDVRLGCKVTGVELDAEQGHRVSTEQGEIRCRWLVDAAGFNTPVGHKLDLIKPLTHHPVSSRWGRFESANAIDKLGDERWRERVNFTSRFLATNHFMYHGYWIWVIPLSEETFSIGVVWRHDMVELDIKGEEDFLAFLNQHRAMREIIGEHGKLIDYHGLKNMARVADQFFSADRWFLVGMSAGFMDPLLSSGSAIIADQNRMVVDLIETDMAGDRQAMANKATCYNVYARWWLDYFLLHISNNYHGSYDLHRLQFEPLLMDYFGVVFPTSVAQRWGYDPQVDYGDGMALKQQKHEMVEQSALKRVHRMAHELAQFLQDHGGVFKHNAGRFWDVELRSEHMRHSVSRGRTLSDEAIMQVQKEIVRAAAHQALTRMAEATGEPLPEEAMAKAVELVTEQGSSLAQAAATAQELLSGAHHTAKRMASAGSWA